MNQLENTMNNIISILWLVPRALGVWLFISGLRDLSTGLHDHQNNQALKGVAAMFGGACLVFARDILRFISGDPTL